MTTYLSSFNAFEMHALQTSECDDVTSISTETEDRTGTDYSLSDIEDGLDTKCNSAQQNIAGNRAMWQTDLELPVTVKRRGSLSLRTLVTRENSQCIMDDALVYSRMLGAKSRRRGISCTNSKTLPHPVRSASRPNANCWIRRRPSRLSVKKQTAKHGAMQIVHLLVNEERILPIKPLFMDETPILDESFRVNSNLEDVNKPFDLCSISSDIKETSLVDEPTPTRLKPAVKALDESQKFDVYRQRSQSHSGFLDSPHSQRSRCSSLLSTRSMKTDTDEDSSSLTSSPCSAVKKWKHYKRAMEAYRKSAERARAVAAATSDKGCVANPLPRNCEASIFERESIYDFWDVKLNLTTPESEEQNSVPLTDQTSEFSSSKQSDDFTTWGNRLYTSSPEKGGRQWNTCDDDNKLSLDYRSLLRNSTSNKDGWSLVRETLKQNNLNRRSMDPDTITDIDAMVGFNDECPKETDQDNSNEDAMISSFVSTELSSQDNVSTQKIDLIGNAEVVVPKSPEKIVWSGYEKYLKQKSEVEKLPRSSFKMRLAALEKKGIHPTSYDLHDGTTTSLSTVAQVHDHMTASDLDLYDTNLRDNKIIRKRNLSLSNSLLNWSNHHKAMDTVQASHVSPYRQYHTVASPARLSKLLRRHVNKSRLSPLASPRIVRANPKRTASLRNKSTCEGDVTIMSAHGSQSSSGEDVFCLPSPAPRLVLDEDSFDDSMPFPSPPAEFLTPTLGNGYISDASTSVSYKTASGSPPSNVFSFDFEKMQSSSSYGVENSNGTTTDAETIENQSIYLPVDCCSKGTPSRPLNQSPKLSSHYKSDKSPSWLYTNSYSPMLGIENTMHERNLRSPRVCTAPNKEDTLYENVATTTSPIPTRTSLPKIVISHTPEMSKKKSSPLLAVAKPSHLQTQTSLSFARAIADGKIYENGSEGVYTTISGDDSDDDYVNYDAFYQGKSMSKCKNKSQDPVTTPKKRTDPDELDQENILPKNMSKLDLDIDGFFSSLSRKKLPSPFQRRKASKSPDHKATNKVKRSSKSFKQSPHKTDCDFGTNHKSSSNLVNVNTNNSSTIKSWFDSLSSSKSLSRFSLASSGLSSNRSSCQTLASLRSPLMGRKSIFDSGEFYSDTTTKRKGKKMKKKVPEISVPLTSIMHEPNAAYTLNLGNKLQEKGESLDRISSFINNNSIQRVGRIREMFESRAKAVPDKKAAHERLFSNVSRVLKLHKITTKSAIQQTHQPPPNVPNSAPSYEIKAPPPVIEEKKSKKKKGKKGKLTKADISMPSGFQHVGHVGWDPNKGFDMNNMDPDVKELFRNAGVTESDMQDKEKAQFIYDFIEKQGGLDAVKQETRKSRDAPPPPPSRSGGAPPPPPSRSGPPPPPHRSNNTRAQAAPPPPQRPQQQQPRGGRGAVPPPPPTSRHGAGPPPPPVQPPSQFPANVPPPPPSMVNIPPPPPINDVIVGGGVPPPPPANAGRGALLSQIQQGTGLKRVSDQPAAAASAPTDGRNALLEAIRKGKDLKAVSNEAAEKSAAASAGEQGLAGALAAALMKRENAIHTDSDDDSGQEFDDEEWSD